MNSVIGPGARVPILRRYMLSENQAMEEIALETHADGGHAEPQVVIAGGGPTGLCLASELALEGWPVPHKSSCFLSPGT